MSNLERGGGVLASAPLVKDVLYGDVALAYKMEDGEYVDQLTLQGLGDTEDKSGRVRLRYAPKGGPLDVMVMAARSHVSSDEERFVPEALLQQRLALPDLFFPVQVQARNQQLRPDGLLRPRLCQGVLAQRLPGSRLRPPDFRRLHARGPGDVQPGGDDRLQPRCRAADRLPVRALLPEHSIRALHQGPHALRAADDGPGHRHLRCVRRGDLAYHRPLRCHGRRTLRVRGGGRRRLRVRAAASDNGFGRHHTEGGARLQAHRSLAPRRPLQHRLQARRHRTQRGATAADLYRTILNTPTTSRPAPSTARPTGAPSCGPPRITTSVRTISCSSVRSRSRSCRTLARSRRRASTSPPRRTLARIRG